LQQVQGREGLLKGDKTRTPIGIDYQYSMGLDACQVKMSTLEMI